MWPFSTDERLRRRVKALETALGDAEAGATTLAAVVKNRFLALEGRVEALDAQLNKVRGKVYGDASAAKTVPNNSLDTMTKSELRQHLGITPGLPFRPSKPNKSEH